MLQHNIFSICINIYMDPSLLMVSLNYTTEYVVMRYIEYVVMRYIEYVVMRYIEYVEMKYVYS